MSDRPSYLRLITSKPEPEPEVCAHLEKIKGICTKCGKRGRGRPKTSHEKYRTKRKRWKRIDGVMTASVFGEKMENCEHHDQLKGICNSCGKNVPGY
jgi:hypothetical protein